MRPPDLREVVDALQEANLEAHAEVARLIERIAAEPPATIQALHDLKAELDYLRLCLRTVREHAAAASPASGAGEQSRRDYGTAIR